MQKGSADHFANLASPQGEGFPPFPKGTLKMEFWEIYDRYYAKVRKFILALVKDQWVANDLIQETFLKVQQNLGTLKDSSKLSSWIFRIAHNLCQDHFRQLKVVRRRGSIGLEQTESLEEAFIQEVSIQKDLEQREMGRCVQNQIDLLPESLRTVLILFDIMEFTHQEISDILGITIKNVKVRLHRARNKMKAILEEQCTFERDERDILICIPINHGPIECQSKNIMPGA